MNNVLITDANANSSLAAVRALGRQDINVSCIGENKKDICFYSKYIKERIIFPSLKTQPSLYLKKLLELVKTKKYDVIFPMTDATVQLILQKRKELEKFIKIPLPLTNSLNIALDKEKTIHFAYKNKIPVPKTYFTKKINRLKIISHELEYPVIIKPKKSRQWKNGKLQGESTVYVNSEEELITKYLHMHKKIPFPIIQERIEGPEYGIFLLFDHGKLKAQFCHKRLRSLNPKGGASVLRESIRMIPKLREYSMKLMKKLDWHGIAMIEFKRDIKDKQYKLMEINGRLWGSLHLSVASGVNFPYLLYRLVMQEEIKPVLKYKTGIKSRWLYGDVSNLVANMKEQQQYLEKTMTLLRFFKIYEKNLVYDDFPLDDLNPGLGYLLKLLNELKNKLKK